MNDHFNSWDTVERGRQTCDNDKQFSRRSWRMCYGTLNMVKCTTKYNAKVQIDQVPASILQHEKKFYICDGCGKVYWFGSHINNALNGELKDILT